MRVRWLLGICVLLLFGCGEDAEPTRPNDFVPLTAINIAPPYPSLAKGTAGQFEAAGDHSGLFVRDDITEQVVWTSSNDAVLRFDDPTRPGWGQSGAPGTVVVSTTLGEVRSDLSFTVTDADVTEIVLQPTEVSRPVGLTQQFSAEGVFSDGTRQDLTTQVAWETSSPNLVTIDANGSAKALAVSSPDPVAITATFAEVSAQAQMTVTAAVLQSILVTTPNASLLAGETQQFTARGAFSDGQSLDLTTDADINWTSSAPAIATVGAKTGMVTAVASGSANITATLGGISGSTPVQVFVPTTITVTPANPTIFRGTTQQLTATATFANGDPREITSLANWTSTNPAVATVDSNGLVTSFATGLTTIRANIQSIAGETRITVLP